MEKVKKNVILAFKTRNTKKVLNKVKLLLDQKLIEYLNIDKEENDIIFRYENKTIFLKKGKVEEEIEIKKDKNILKIIKNISPIWEKKREGYFVPIISIPLGVASEMEINNNENKGVEITKKDKELIIKKELIMKEKQISILINGNITEIDKRFLEKIDDNYYSKKNGKVITIKVGKGGIGKTFITTQLGIGLAEYGLKVLIITSDPQNDILGMCFPKEKEPEYENGLKSWVLKGDGDIVRLRKGVDFIPLENSTFGNTFKNKFSKFLNLMKCKYDFILIDSMPMMAIDKYFHEESDKIIIPLFGDKFTIRGAGKVMEEIGLEKVLAVIFNRFDNTSEQKVCFDEVKGYIEDSNVLMPKPIKRLSYIQTMTAKGKTIWDNKKIIIKEDGTEEIIYNNKQLDEVRKSFIEVIDKIITETYQEPEIIGGE